MLPKQTEKELREDWTNEAYDIGFSGDYSHCGCTLKTKEIADHWLSVIDRLLEEEIAALRAKIEAIDLSTMTYGGFRRKVLGYLTKSPENKGIPEDTSKEVRDHKPHPCSCPDLSDECSGCFDPDPLGGTHAGCTKQHGHVGCDLATNNSK